MPEISGEGGGEGGGKEEGGKGMRECGGSRVEGGSCWTGVVRSLCERRRSGRRLISCICLLLRLDSQLPVLVYSDIEDIF